MVCFICFLGVFYHLKSGPQAAQCSSMFQSTSMWCFKLRIWRSGSLSFDRSCYHPDACSSVSGQEARDGQLDGSWFVWRAAQETNLLPQSRRGVFLWAFIINQSILVNLKSLFCHCFACIHPGGQTCILKRVFLGTNDAATVSLLQVTRWVREQKLTHWYVGR